MGVCVCVGVSGIGGPAEFLALCAFFPGPGRLLQNGVHHLFLHPLPLGPADEPRRVFV